MKKYKDTINSLSEIQYNVTQKNGTERPFNNEYYEEERQGIYIDVVSKKPLFSSLEKFDAHCGWPSFTKPLNDIEVIEVKDISHGMHRTEVRSTDADSHLGHVFDDGPDGNLRYCINSASLEFVPVDDLEKRGLKEYLNTFKK